MGPSPSPPGSICRRFREAGSPTLLEPGSICHRFTLGLIEIGLQNPVFSRPDSLFSPPHRHQVVSVTVLPSRPVTPAQSTECEHLGFPILLRCVRNRLCLSLREVKRYRPLKITDLFTLNLSQLLLATFLNRPATQRHHACRTVPDATSSALAYAIEVTRFAWSLAVDIRTIP